MAQEPRSSHITNKYWQRFQKFLRNLVIGPKSMKIQNKFVKNTLLFNYLKGITHLCRGQVPVGSRRNHGDQPAAKSLLPDANREKASQQAAAPLLQISGGQRSRRGQDRLGRLHSQRDPTAAWAVRGRPVHAQDLSAPLRRLQPTCALQHCPRQDIRARSLSISLRQWCPGYSVGHFHPSLTQHAARCLFAVWVFVTDPFHRQFIPWKIFFKENHLLWKNIWFFDRIINRTFNESKILSIMFIYFILSIKLSDFL